MARLSDIELDRVDGVDEPATRRKFLILKAEEPDELRQNVKELLDKVEAALRALAKAEDLMLSDEAAKALNDVAKALDLDIAFKAGRKHRDEEEYGYPPPKKTKKGEEEDGIAKMLERLDARLDEQESVLKALIDRLSEPVAKASSAASAASRQPRAQDATASRARDPWHDVFFAR